MANQIYTKMLQCFKKKKKIIIIVDEQICGQSSENDLVSSVVPSIFYLKRTLLEGT